MSISVLFLVVLNLRNLNLRSVHMNLTPAMHTKTKVGLDFVFPHQVTIFIRSGPMFNLLQAVSCCEHPILVDESSATTDAWPDNNPQLFISFYCYLPNLTRNASWIPSSWLNNFSLWTTASDQKIMNNAETIILSVVWRGCVSELDCEGGRCQVTR